MGRSLGNVSLEENWCPLEVPDIPAEPQPERYNSLYSFSLKKSIYVKKVVVKLHL